MSECCFYQTFRHLTPHCYNKNVSIYLWFAEPQIWFSWLGWRTTYSLWTQTTLVHFVGCLHKNSQYFKKPRLYFQWKLLSKQTSTLTMWRHPSWVIDDRWIGHTAAPFSLFRGRIGHGSPMKSCEELKMVEGSNSIGSGGGNWYSHTICGF